MNGVVSGVLIGVDAVEVARVGRALGRWGRTYLDRLCTAAERATLGSDVTLAAASVAVKESLIKAVGGRPPRFDWHDLEVGVGPTARTDWLDRHAIEASGALVALGAGAAVRRTSCTLHRGSRRMAAARLAPGGVDPRVVATAVWTVLDGLLIAVAVLSREE
jgi:holo-[acyl-carrier protein] synthase